MTVIIETEDFMTNLRQETAPKLDFTPARVGSTTSKIGKMVGSSIVFYGALFTLIGLVDVNFMGGLIFWTIIVGVMSFILPTGPTIFLLLLNIPGWIFSRFFGKDEKLEKLFSNFYFDSQTSEIVVKSFFEDIRLPIELLEDFQHSKTSENIVHFQFSEAADPEVCKAIRTENLTLKPAEFEKAFFALRSKAVS